MTQLVYFLGSGFCFASAAPAGNVYVCSILLMGFDGVHPSQSAIEFAFPWRGVILFRIIHPSPCRNPQHSTAEQIKFRQLRTSELKHGRAPAQMEDGKKWVWLR